MTIINMEISCIIIYNNKFSNSRLIVKSHKIKKINQKLLSISKKLIISNYTQV